MTNIYQTKNDRHRFSLLLLLFLLVAGFFQKVQAENPFVPGVGGTLPTFTEFQPEAGKVGGFMVYSSIRRSDFFGTGTDAEVNMSFPDAATYGTETIVLQYKKTDGTWASFLNNTTEVTTTGNNFSLNLYQSYTFRLLLRGGANNGCVSNEQTADLATVDTYFSQSTLDESMFITGVIAPWVGRGLQVSFVVKKLSDGSVVDGGLSYQWYRVNPVTFEQTAIPGATGLTYATTTADIGYRMMIVATGNQTTVGGFYKMMSGWGIVSPNKCFVTNSTTNGFTLNLYQDVAKLDTGELILRDKDYLKVPISSVTKETGNGVFQINAALSLDKSPYFLQNKSNFWKISTEMAFGPMHDLMEGVIIDLAASSVGEISNETPLNLLYEVSSNRILFTSISMVKTVSMYNLAGSLLGHWNVNQFEGRLPVGTVTPGVYTLRFTTDKGSLVRKVMVIK
ncbi:MAG TPA: T9SS type A sorting domain-containing protein [Bacteroidales bacterium]|nr:T9SS type A sorting domain-containing protein [Bacteroidales bacterium]